MNTKLLFSNTPIKVIALAILIAGLPGCKKFVEIDPPVNQLVTQSVFSSNGTATAAQLSVYAQYSGGALVLPAMVIITGFSSDELFNYSTDPGYIDYYTNTILPNVESAGDIWSPAYNFIYQENAILAGVKNNNAINAKVAQQLTGEAEFVRAYWYFYLTNLFGDVPLVTTTDYSVNSLLARSSRADVYKQIVADLLDAQGKLNDNYIDGSDTAVTTERVRPTSWAASAFLARVYLYLNDYSDAYTQANKVIGNTALFSMQDSLNQVFLKNNGEAIWQLQASTPGQDTWEGNFLILPTTPFGSTNNCATISPQLWSAFEPNDARKVHWIDSVVVGPDVYYFPYKYKIFTESTNEYSTMFRLAEQYLIRAEAQAYGAGNGIPGAISDMNVIRKRAGLLPYAGAADQTSVVSAILHERQVELFTEGCHRWFDLKRTGTVNSVLGAPGGVCATKGGVWNSNDTLYAIPQSERNNDPNLTQNPGY